MPHRASSAAAPPGQRQLRVAELIRRSLSEILREQGAELVVSEVRIGPDLRQALVLVETLGGDHAAETIAGLNRSAGRYRRELAHQVTLRHTPELRFARDDRFEAAARVDRLLAGSRGGNSEG